MKFTEIEPQNYRQACALSVKPQQSGYLSSAPMILARAYAFRQQNSQVWLIEAEEEAVGIIMIREADQGQTIVLDQFFIDQCFQGRGYGRRAVEQLLQKLRKSKAKQIVLCCREADQIAQRLYRSLGFVETGERDEDEILFSLNWD